MTEQAYDNPRFVEDMVRGVAVRLQQDARVVVDRATLGQPGKYTFCFGWDSYGQEGRVLPRCAA